MKIQLLFLYLFLFFGVSSYAQEDCADGIDNDGDTFIDLNDPDCDCVGLGTGGGTIEGLIPNPSFEDMTCCPSSFGMLSCADTWIQASSASSDYWHNCGWSTTTIFTDAAMPLPGEPGGEGWAGFISGWSSSATYNEMVGACLTSPMLAGTPYVMNLWMAKADGSPDLTFTVYGTSDCADLPWADTECPIGEGDFQILGQTDVNFPTEGDWYEVTVTFTPSVDIYAVALGGDCTTPPVPAGDTYNYYYVDELTLTDSASFASGDIVESGTYCGGDLALTSAIDTVGWGVQWYLEGIALPGETSETINVMSYGPGTYQVVYTVGADCDEASYTVVIPDDPVADFDVSDICFPLDADFTDASSIASGSITGWDWDFGDTFGTSTDQNPTYGYGTDGTYDVTLIVTSDDGCTDDTTIAVTVFPQPTADFEFEIDGASSADGLTGGCYLNAVDFLDGSTIGGGGTITNWSWQFGSDGSSTDMNPTHTFSGPGTYVVELTVTTADGCVHVFTMPVVMTDSPDVDIIFNDPTCFGFNDGSITILLSGGAGGTSTFFDIQNSAGTSVNVGGSNTANSLVSGTYTWEIEDGGCSADGSVTLNDPPIMEIDLDITHVLCHGDLTGSVEVDTVDYHQGGWDEITYIWEPGLGGGEGVTSVDGLGAGEYSLTVNDSAGCAQDTTFFIEEPTALVFSEIGYEPAYCRLYGYQIGSGQVFGAATGGTSDYTYEWTNLQTGATSTNTTWGGLNPGDYEIVVTDANGCLLTQIITLDSLNPEAIIDIESLDLNGNLEGTAVVCIEAENESINYINPIDPSADVSIWVSLDFPNEPWVLYEDEEVEAVFDTCYAVGGEYDVCIKVQNKNGCQDSVCHTITVFDPLVVTPPNIFTPDGDGINDVFSFEFLSKGINDINIIIVNRWGVKMAEVNGLAAGWDGTDRNGSICRDGVYFYTYSGTAENGDPFSGQGTIQLIGAK